MQHKLKTLPKWYKDVVSGAKTFEVRRNDRNFQVGDTLLLQEWSQESGYTGKSVERDVFYILDETEYLKEGYVVLGFA
jgi:hypothetical protein